MILNNQRKSAVVSATPSEGTSGLYAQIVESSADAIVVTTLEGFVTYWNGAAERLYGVTSAEMLGRGFTELIPGHLDSEYHAYRWRVSTGIRVEPWFTSHRHKQGQTLEVRVSMSALLDASGTAVGIVYLIGTAAASEGFRAALLAQPSSLVSVTDFALEALSQSERQRLETESQYRLLVESAVDYAIFSLDLDGRVKNWNLGARRLYGYKADDILGKHLEVFYLPDTRRQRQAAQALEGVSRDGRYQDEGARVRKNGSEFWAHTNITSIQDGNGRAIGYAVIVRDLTEQRQLMARQELLGASVENTPDCVLITDADLNQPGPRILYVNRSFERMSGYKLEELQGQTPRLFQGPQTDQAMLKRLRKALDEKRVFVAETTNYRKDGTAYRVRWQIAPIHNSDGKITHFVSVQQDVSAHRSGVDLHASFPEVVRVLDFTVSGGPLLPGSSLRGRLEDVGGAGSLVQMLSVVNPSGALILNGQIRLHFRGGRIVYLEHPHLTGLEAAVQAFQLESGSFEFSALEHQPEGVLAIDPVSVALEAARRSDEAKQSGEWLPDITPIKSEGFLVLPTVQVALAFASSVGLEHFRAELQRDPSWEGERVVLTGRGFRVVAVTGRLDELPPQIDQFF